MVVVALGPGEKAAPSWVCGLWTQVNWGSTLTLSPRVTLNQLLNCSEAHVLTHKRRVMIPFLWICCEGKIPICFSHNSHNSVSRNSLTCAISTLILIPDISLPSLTSALLGLTWGHSEVITHFPTSKKIFSRTVVAWGWREGGNFCYFDCGDGFVGISKKWPNKFGNLIEKMYFKWAQRMEICINATFTFH